MSTAVPPIPQPDPAATVAPMPPSVGGGPPVPPRLEDTVVDRWRASGAPMIDLLREAAAVGPVSGFALGGRQVVLATGADPVQDVLARRSDRYVKRSHRARVLLGDGLICAVGDAWRSQRRLLQARFTVAGTRHWEAHIVAAAARLVQRWRRLALDGGPTDVGEDMRFFALDTVWRTLTGHPLHPATHRELRAIDEVVAALPTTAPAPTPSPERGRPTGTASATHPRRAEVPPGNDAVRQALAQVDTVAYQAIARARRERAAGTGSGLLHLLLDQGDVDSRYDDRMVRDELVTLLVAGHETTAKTLTWLFVLLHRYPEVAAGLGRDVGPGGRPAVVGALVSETLRLCPVVWLVPRHAAESDVLGGYRVDAGTEVLVCPYLTHRDPTLWDAPESFAPQRFLPGGSRPSHPGAYLPFGVGARACLGTHFALREMTTLLERLLATFTPRLVDAPTGAVFGANLRPDGPTPAVIQPGGPLPGGQERLLTGRHT